jgi:glucose-1-phosphate thymidylyltransferase
MKMTILCGGLGTRLGVTTKVVNKHLLPIGGLPMVAKPLALARLAGLPDALLISNPESIGSFARLAEEDIEPFKAVRCYFTSQQAPLGIANAIGCARHYCQDGPVAVCLGDNWFTDEDMKFIASRIAGFEKDQWGCEFWVKEVPDPSDYGVLELSPDGQPIAVIEKPAMPPSPYAVIGVYLFDSQVWDVISNLSPSKRGEYEVTDLITWYLQRGEAKYHKLIGDWYDLGRSLDNYLRISYLIHHNEGGV